MNPTDIAQRYFDAWNQRDPHAIVTSMVEGGIYRDPLVPQGITGPALVAYASTLFASFPDVTFELVSLGATDEHRVAAQWIMRGTNTGPRSGRPPTNKTVALPGADFIAVADDRVHSVQGYFDQKTMSEQLGFQVLTQPSAAGPLSFGTSQYVHLGNSAQPGAFTLTWIEAQSDEEVQQLEAMRQKVAMGVARVPGFISWMGVAIGRRLYTITAWTDVESSQQLSREGAHSRAQELMYSSPLGAAVFTSVWTAHRDNMLMVRCPSCGRMANYAQGKCSCGAALPTQSRYW